MMHARSRQRHGISILLVLICLIVVTGAVAAMLRNLTLVNRQAKQRRFAVQADWLAESGMERAAAALVRDVDYRKEVWNVTDPTWGQRSGQVEIKVEPHKAEADRVRVTSAATFPVGETIRVTTRKTRVMSLSRTNNLSQVEKSDATE